MKALHTIQIAAVSAIMLFTIPSIATANDPGGCFMVTSSGKTVSLRELCGMKPKSSTPRVFRVPIKRRSGNIPIVDVNFNGNQVFEMMVDTGASGILITQKMATALNIQASGTQKGRLADGSIVKFKTSKVQRISVGGAIVNDARVTIAPKANIGLLGQGFFGKYDIKILQKQVEFYPR